MLSDVLVMNGAGYLIQYPLRRLSDRNHDVSKLRDWYLEF